MYVVLAGAGWIDLYYIDGGSILPSFLKTLDGKKRSAEKEYLPHHIIILNKPAVILNISGLTRTCALFFMSWTINALSLDSLAADDRIVRVR